MKSKRFAIVLDTRRCIDCKACTVACKAENDVPLGQSNRRNWVNDELNGIFPNLVQEFTPGQCQHCAIAPCQKICPTEATYTNENGVVLINAEECAGCKICMPACPYDARYFKEELEVVDKCSFCIQRIAAGRIPACVETCPTQVRTFGDLNDPRSEISVLLAKNKYKVLKKHEGTGPKLFYLI